ncbi:flagellar hook-length control protein FliK [Salibacterium sp. K-3]
MQMQMLMQTLPNAELNTQRTGKSESGEGGQKGFMQMLGKALNAAESEGQTSGTASGHSIEDLLSGFFQNGDKLFEQFKSELKALFENGDFEWSGNMQDMLEQLPQGMQDLAQSLTELDSEQMLQWLEQALTSSEEAGAELPEAIQNQLSGQESGAVENWNGQEQKLASSFTGMLALLNQALSQPGMQQNDGGSALAQANPNASGSSGFSASLSMLAASLTGSSRQQTATPEQAAKQMSQWMENASGQQNQLKTMEGFTQTWKNTSSFGGETKQNYLQQLLNRSLSSSGGDTSSANAQPASMSSQDATGVMAKAQQAVIHLGEGKTEHARAQEFMKQFQELLGKSNLQSFKNGTQQLTVKLVPESLGRLDVKIMQQNGQLTAQLMTTTSTAREMVESQLHQLRAAFQQQNIQVDRIDISQQQPSTLQQDDGNQEDGEQQDNPEVHEDETDAGSEESFADMLDALTFNEQV